MSAAPISNSKKRPAEGDAPASKRRKAKKPQFEDDGVVDPELGINRTVAKMDSQLMADYLAQKTARFGTDLSSVELADISIPAGWIKDTTSWKEQRVMEKLPEFLEDVAKDPKSLREASKDFGAPHTIIVTGAGIRAANVVRVMRKFQSKENLVAKLFAKHMKIEQQVGVLNKCRTGIAVGTPARLADLLENGALSIAHLKRVVVDASHVGQKKQGVLDMKDTLIPLTQLLTRKQLMERYISEKAPVDLIFY